MVFDHRSFRNSNSNCCFLPFFLLFPSQGLELFARKTGKSQQLLALEYPSSFPDSASPALYSCTLFYMAILLLVIIFLIYQHFVKSYRVWDSIGAGFSTFKKNWKKTALLVLF